LRSKTRFNSRGTGGGLHHFQKPPGSRGVDRRVAERADSYILEIAVSAFSVEARLFPWKLDNRGSPRYRVGDPVFSRPAKAEAANV